MATISDGISLGSGGGGTSSSHSVTIGPGVTYAFGGAYGAAIFGPPPNPWTVTNFGLITATGAGSAGLWLQSGGTVANTGSIGGTLYGINVPQGTGLVTNTGAISGTYRPGGAGVQLQGGGSVTNSTSGIITGGNAGAVYIRGGTYDHVLNLGTLIGLGSAGAGVALWSGGTVQNGASDSTAALVSGSANGIGIIGGDGTVANFGSVTALGAGGYGVHLFGGGIVVNGSTTDHSGHIIGNLYGVGIIGGAGSVQDNGTIVATGGTGVRLGQGGSVTIASGGTVSGATAGVSIGGNVGTIRNAGSIGGGVTFTAGFPNRLQIDPGGQFAGIVDGANKAPDGSVSTLELDVGPSAGLLAGLGTQFLNFGSIVFDAGAQWEIVGNVTAFGGTISGFTIGDTIEVSGITVTGSSYAGGVLTLFESSGSIALDLPGSFTSASFNVTNVTGAADVSLTAPCFRVGTRIHTPSGDVRVEELQPGNLVLTDDRGRAAPRAVKWLGERVVNCRRHPKPRLVWPVRILVDAFGTGRPYRDLWLSPDHAVFFEGLLIPVKHLVNGTSIVQMEVNEVHYFHIELSRHSILLAEGLAVESYLDTGDRSKFGNGGGLTVLYPDFASRTWDGEGYAPLVVAGPQLAAAQQWVNTIAVKLRRAHRTVA